MKKFSEMLVETRGFFIITIFSFVGAIGAAFNKDWEVLGLAGAVFMICLVVVNSAIKKPNPKARGGTS